jgi:hypothetical protein
MRAIIYIAVSAALFALGWFSHLLLRGEDTPSYHWRKLAELKDYAQNPDNYGAALGFRYLSPPFDDTPHLEALVGFGELEKRNVLIPSLPVSKENTKDWMRFASHPDVIQAKSQGSYYDGEVPLSFMIWYRPAFADSVEAYIEHLNEANKTSLDNPLPPGESEIETQ